MNNIAQQGLDELAAQGLAVNAEAENPDGLLIRSAKLHDAVFGDKLLAIARAGVGTDNVPVARCTEQGIAVFNTAGANAQAVKELALCALLLASRDVVGGIEWARSLAGSGSVAAQVEKGKSAFVGPELSGKTLGVIGLGAIGSLVANAAAALGMTVYGYDPYLSVDAAWRLSSEVRRADDMDGIFKKSDYIMIQVHCNDSTRGMLSADAFAKMRDGVRIINLARGELVDDEAMLAALESGRVARYVTDFPNDRIVTAKGVVAMPHLGASTPESEEKCAVMAAQELSDYLRNGNITHSVNLPEVHQPRAGGKRICIIHKNEPGMISQITALTTEAGLNIENMVNKSKKNMAYTMLDATGAVNDALAVKLSAIPAVVRVRIL